MNCEYCHKEFTIGKSVKRFCNDNCRALFHYYHSVKVKNIKAKKQEDGFVYENIGGQIILKPMEDHVYDPGNTPGISTIKTREGQFSFHHGRLDDRTNYYRGNGIFGYDDHVAIGIEDESSIE